MPETRQSSTMRPDPDCASDSAGSDVGSIGVVTGYHSEGAFVSTPQFVGFA